MSVSYMRPSGSRIHIQTGFHRVTPCMQFCLHGLSPVLDTLHCIKASIQGLLIQVFEEQRRPSEFILFAATRGLSLTCGKGFAAAKRTVRRNKKASTRFYRSGSTR